MSSIKTICLRSASEERQSFGERICDDLSEVILQYLSFEDKLRLECVSKQFQRTVLQRQSYLLFDDKYLTKDNELNMKTVGSVLKKCPNIRRISCSSKCGLILYSETIIDLIVNHCHNVSEINCDLFYNELVCNKLVQIIDSDVLSVELASMANLLSLSSIKYVFQSLAFVKNLKIKDLYFNATSDMMALQNLSRVSVFYDYNRRNDLQTLFENNKSLTHIDINAHMCDSNQLNHLLSQISTLNNLLEVNILSKIPMNDKSLTNSLTQMAFNCYHLKSISCNIYFHPMDALSSFKSFTHLRRLSVRVILYGPKHSFSFNTFQGFDSLTHLSLTTSKPISERSLTDIDKYLPKLTYLQIRPMFAMSEYTAHNLSQLSNLVVIDIIVENDGIAQQMSAKLLENCPKIRWIRFSKPKELPFQPFQEYLQQMFT